MCLRDPALRADRRSLDVHGFPTYGNGPFERIGVHTNTALLVAFLVVRIAEVAVGMMLWADAPYAPIVSYALLPFELAFWIGFALPLGRLLGITRTGLLIVTRPSVTA